VDINGDGHLDILSGSYSRTEPDMAGLFQVLYGKGDGTFRKAEVLKGTDGQPLIIPTKNSDQITDKICTRPFAVDWDGDGHLDLVVGNFAGTFYWFKGEGKGRFRPTPELIKAGSEPLRIPGAHSDPFVVDWDGDGDLDILSGSSDAGRLQGGTGPIELGDRRGTKEGAGGVFQALPAARRVHERGAHRLRVVVSAEMTTPALSPPRTLARRASEGHRLSLARASG
jgi:hypothetical protein